MKAIWDNDLNTIKGAVAAGNDLNVRLSGGATCLIYAAALGHVDMVRLLVSAGVDLNLRDDAGRTAWSRANELHVPEKNRISMTAILKSAGAVAPQEKIRTSASPTKERSSPRELEIQDRNVDSVIEDRPSEVSQDSIAKALHQPRMQQELIEIATNSGDSPALKALFDAGIGVNEALLNLNLISANYDVAKYFLTRGANPNARNDFGTSPLMSCRDARIAAELIGAGAEVNARNWTGNTPLILANDSNIIRRLIAAGADVNAANSSGDTALMSAADPVAARLLIESGADLEAQNEGGQTALMLHARFGNSETTKLLIAANAKLDLCDKNGLSAMRHARAEYQRDIVKLLASAGASSKGRLADIIASNKKRLIWAGIGLTSVFGLFFITMAIVQRNDGQIRKARKVHVNGSVLTMREEPHIQGKFIYSIPDRTVVEQLEESGETLRISGKAGKWTRIKVHHREGWVFGGFLD